MLRKYSKHIKDFGYITDRVLDYQGYGAEIRYADRANLISMDTSSFALQPSKILDDSFKYSFTQSNITLPFTE